MDTTTTTTTLLAPGCIAADTDKRIMLLIVGEPFSGKSTAAATFPNAVFLDFDHKAPKGSTIVPFWSAEFCDKYIRRRNPQNDPPNQRDALLRYLSTELSKIPSSSTLILDSMTAVETAFHVQTERVEQVPIGKGGAPDGFYVWREKQKYFDNLLALLKTFPGHVILIMHEQQERNDAGQLINRIKPLMTGSWPDKIPSHFTCMFRQRILTQGTQPKAVNGRDIDYVWEVKPTAMFNSNNNFNPDIPPIIRADWSTLRPYVEGINLN